MKTVLVERYATLGGVCLNVGCIPSKALLHIAAVADEVAALAEHGMSFGEREIDLDKLRGWKEKVVGKLTGGLAGMAKARNVQVVRGSGRFLDPHHLEVELTAGSGQEKTGQKTVVRFEKAIIAAGSQAVKLPFIPDDPRVVDSTGALELRQLPMRMLVIGGGIIGLEMATVYSTLGTKIDVVEMLDGLMTGADRDLVRVWEKKNAGRFASVMLKTRTTGAEATPQGIKVSFEGEKAPQEPQVYDLVLVAVGRSPNGKKIDAEKAGVAVTDHGFIAVDKQMRTNSRTSLRSATSSATRCWRTRRCTRPMSPRRRRPASARSSTHAKSHRSPTPIRRWRGRGSPRSNVGRRASSSARRCSPG